MLCKFHNAKCSILFSCWAQRMLQLISRFVTVIFIFCYPVMYRRSEKNREKKKRTKFQSCICNLFYNNTTRKRRLWDFGNIKLDWKTLHNHYRNVNNIWFSHVKTSLCVLQCSAFFEILEANSGGRGVYTHIERERARKEKERKSDARIPPKQLKASLRSIVSDNSSKSNWKWNIIKCINKKIR